MKDYYRWAKEFSDKYIAPYAEENFLRKFSTKLRRKDFSKFLFQKNLVEKGQE